MIYDFDLVTEEFVLRCFTQFRLTYKLWRSTLDDHHDWLRGTQGTTKKVFHMYEKYRGEGYYIRESDDDI